MFEPCIMLLARADGSRVDTSFKQQPLNAADPFSAGRLVAWSGRDGVSAGMAEAEENLDIEYFPHTEVIVVHTGHVTLKTPERTLQLAVGTSAVIGQGTALRIEAQTGTRWAYCAMATTGAPPGLTSLDPLAHLSPSAAPEHQILIGPTPQCRSGNAFEDATTDLRVGVWDSTPYERHGRPHKLNELMHLIEGTVTLQTSDGSSVTINTGDSVFVARGAPCAWKSAHYVRKIYAVK
ncbi:MAG TPA: cupin [Pseudomonas sp.]|nr:cupin [Pseudomonas sp.]